MIFNSLLDQLEFMNLKIINNILKLNVNSCLDEENSSSKLKI